MNQLFKIYPLIVVIVLIVFMLFITVPWEEVIRRDPGIIMSFILNGGLWGFLLFNELKKRAYSLLIIHWLFCFIFFFMIAFMQYMYDSFPKIGSCSDEIILQTNLLLLIWSLFLLLGYKLSNTKNVSIKKNKHTKIVVPHWLIIVLTVFSVLIMLYRISKGTSVLFEENLQISYAETSSVIKLLKEHLLQALSFFAAIFPIVRYQQLRKGLIFVFITLVALLISYFPVGGTSRYAIAVIYGGLLLTTFKSLRKNRMFIVMLLLGFLVIFPFLNAFRHTNFKDVDLGQAFLRTFHELPNIWKAGDYDAYSMITLTLEYIQDYGITWGKQLLGVLFFWVPRSLWITKPIGTGAFVATQKGWLFTNLSAPLPAEAIINFGRLGMLLWAFGLGWLISKLDNFYWKNLNLNNKDTYPFDLLYPILIMFFFFMSRGDLLSSTAYMMSYITVWWIICLCCKEIKI